MSVLFVDVSFQECVGFGGIFMIYWFYLGFREKD